MATDTATQLAALRLRREELELEVMESQVAKMRAEKLTREQERRRLEHDIAEQARQRARSQALCTHKKGGKGPQALVNGNGSDYSVWKVTYPTGQVMVMCSRCYYEWKAPEPALRKVDPKAFREQEAAYREALALPTDNEPMGKRLFLIEPVAS